MQWHYIYIIYTSVPTNFCRYQNQLQEVERVMQKANVPETTAPPTPPPAAPCAQSPVRKPNAQAVVGVYSTERTDLVEYARMALLLLDLNRTNSPNIVPTFTSRSQASEPADFDCKQRAAE